MRDLTSSLTAEDITQHTLRDSTNNSSISETERTLRTLWAELLQNESHDICSDDNIFQLGGDSIVVIKLVTAASIKGIHLTVTDISQHPSLSDMASQADKNHALDISASINYERFSLLGMSDISSFLDEAICPYTLTPRASVIDVFPTTDFQALSVAGALSKSRFELGYFYIDGDGSHNLEHLRQSFLELINRLEILRTAYIFHQQSLLQMALSSYTPAIPIYEIEDAIDDFSNKLTQDNMGRPPCLGQPLLDLAIIKHKSSLKHRVVLRMSHASYDAVSLTTLWTTLQSIYEGSSATIPSHFASYVSDISTKISPETYRYWHTLLHGSSMPQIGPQSRPTHQTPFSRVLSP